MATQKKFIADLGFETPSDLTVNGNATIDGNATVTGNLTVNGTSTTVNSTTTSVTDSMIELANANTGSDTLDIGIYGNYDDGLSDGGASEYTGLFRDASDSTWKLFDGLESEPTTTVNIAGTGYAKAALEVGDLSCTTLTATNSMTGASLSYPTSDGSAGQVIKTDGNGTLSFTTISGYTDSDVETYLDSGTSTPTFGAMNTNGAITLGNASYWIGNATNGYRFNNSADTLNLLVIKDNGNVGIGQSSPNAKLDVKGSYSSPQALIGYSDGDGIFIHAQGGPTHTNWCIGQQKNMTGLEFTPSTTAGGTTFTNPAMVIEPDGNVGIGVGNPTQSLEVVDSDNYKGILIRGSNAPCLTFAQGTSTTPAWRTGISGYDGTAFAISTGASVGDVVHIESNGDFGIGTTSATSRLHVNAGTYAGYAVDLVQEGSGGGNHGLRVVSASGSSYTAIFRANASTVFYVDGAGNYYFSGSSQSDVNKKENIADITDSALDLITQLQPKTYNFIGSDVDKAGFIAQEMETVIPRLVTGNTYDPGATDEDGNNPTGKGIDYMGYTAYLTKAIQEQQTIIEDLRTRIETLESA